MMPKFRKKPVEVEAWRNRVDEEPPSWVHDAAIEFPKGGSIIIETLEGNMRAMPGDWIIRGVRGEIYPCKPDIFEQTYEADNG